MTNPKQIKIKCLNCGREEWVVYAVAIIGQWQCICCCTLWEEVENAI